MPVSLACSDEIVLGINRLAFFSIVLVIQITLSLTRALHNSEHPIAPDDDFG